MPGSGTVTHREQLVGHKHACLFFCHSLDFTRKICLTIAARDEEVFEADAKCYLLVHLLCQGDHDLW